MELTLNWLKQIGIKSNIENSLFGKPGMEYLGFCLTLNVIELFDIKFEAMNNMTPPTSCKGVSKFIGLVKYYHSMW